jgi:NAD(P)-dependent dehydrogenase (short-subunit alcohol dehydrogenase family)
VSDSIPNSTQKRLPRYDISMARIRAQFQDNLFGTIAFTQPFITHFRERRSGHIINISSMAAFVNYPSVGVYSASKAALKSFSDSLSHEVASFGVRVHVVLPGYFPTNILRPRTNDTTDQTIPVAEGCSKVYTEMNQGYNIANVIPQRSASLGHIGDPAVLARRVYELVADIGIARDLKLNERPWLRMFLGSDSGEEVLRKLGGIYENCRVTEPIWRSTDVKQGLAML